MKLRYIFSMAFLLVFAAACTNLDEVLNGDLTGEEATDYLADNTDVDALLRGVYEEMRLPYQDQSRFWAAQEHTTDEVMGPTRGPDWDDNGIWRVLHDHTWDAEHAFLASTFDELLGIVFSSTNVLNFNPTPQQAAEARFIRAFVMLSVLDGWGQVPFRQPGENLLDAPRVLSGSEAADFIINELNEIMDDLPDNGPATRASKYAAHALLMKAHLNRGTYADRANPSFDAADMDAVILNADAIINSGKYAVSANYWDNFAPDNDVLSTENIFTAENRGGESSGNVRSRWMCTLHYNQNPSGWNGFTTIADFYDKFDANDPRLSGEYPTQTDLTGVRVGFLEGQQFDVDGNALQDRKGNPLSFTKDVSLRETGNDLEVTGIRVVKYVIDFAGGDNADNDYVFLRFADVWLMKAEALLRKGDVAGALDMVNILRSARGADELGTLDADALLDERGFELYWEGHRRSDLIRFGKFLDAYTQKQASGPERLVFPIPSAALAVNPNLIQNPGY